MKMRLVLVLLAVGLTAAPARATTILPDACGSDDVKFKVKTPSDSTDPAKPKPTAPVVVPVEGKARVVFIETVVNIGFLFDGPKFTTRFGVDGKWVGAANNNSYFILDLEPGTHHLCSSVQGGDNAPKDKIGISSFEAEAGKVYYLAYKISNKNMGTLMVAGSTPVYVPHVDSSNGLQFLDEDEGKFQVKAAKVATSTSKQHKDDWLK